MSHATTLSGGTGDAPPRRASREASVRTVPDRDVAGPRQEPAEDELAGLSSRAGDEDAAADAVGERATVGGEVGDVVST